VSQDIKTVPEAVPSEVSPGGNLGLGIPPATVIASLPPLEELASALPIDPKTGEPSRHFSIPLAYLLFLLAAVCQLAGLGLAWWRAIHMETFATAIRLLQWTNPTPGSLASIGLSIAMTVIGAVLIATPALSGYLSWVGQPAAGWWAIAAFVLTPLTLLISPTPMAFNWNNIGWLAVPLIVGGAILILLPPAQRSLTNWQVFRQQSSVSMTANQPIRYGRLEQYQ